MTVQTDLQLQGVNGIDHFTPCRACKASLPFTGKLCDPCRDKFRRFHQLGEHRVAPR